MTDVVRVRDMVVDDCEAVAEVRVRGWQTTYEGLIPTWYLAAMTVEADAETRRTHFAQDSTRTVNLVAERAGSVVGWACYGPYRDGRAPTGEAELYALYARPDQLSTGVGRALMDEATTRAAGEGYAAMRLWVLRDNARARRFYEKAGFAPDGAEEPWHVAGTTVTEVRYARRLPA
ncbi:GNAT family N-acetyltransferase [Streptomyces sp. CB03238]|uniref:GNAT family N-acetyltransferase n=1 Tax=Streptomyces sp. CB03238 TaxID=1907777 RepID=UPI000A0F600D|nr:GNAT family N-acetyltransferase [Streptomyces sp. CB03238]ORT58359.1 GNAT family N-acetyltransferase [Streptomyces sp. CB03238]